MRPRTFMLSVTALFLIYTAWCMTARGILETPYLDPESSHFDAGAGDWTLIARAVFSVVLSIALLAVSVVPPFDRTALISLAFGLLIVPLFIFSAVGLQRYAPDYSEEAFRSILTREYDGAQIISKSDVLAAIGEPVARGRRVQGEEIWCYTYMPSCGFGWDKRVLWFRGDRVTNVYAMSEP